MSKGFFTDKTFRPAEKDIENILGEAGNNWDSIILHLTSELNLKGVFRFYGVNYGWALRFIKSGKSIIALYPDKNCFMVQIILNNKQVDAALSENLNKQILKLIREKEAIHEGKWIYLRIDKLTVLEDIFKLINIRIKIK
jgi:hypothetical protein